jgi:hypothetical protein
MGGGGSINYTMIHESSTWLSKNIGQSEKYWDDMKTKLSAKLNRKTPFVKKSEDFTKIIKEKASGMEKCPLKHLCV